MLIPLLLITHPGTAATPNPLVSLILSSICSFMLNSNIDGLIPENSNENYTKELIPFSRV
jgi:hypothetical protein